MDAYRMHLENPQTLEYTFPHLFPHHPSHCIGKMTLYSPSKTAFHVAVSFLRS